jgi:acetyltransferase
MVGEQSIKEARQILHKNQVPLVIFPEVPGQLLGAMAQYHEWMANPQSAPFATNNQNREQVTNLLSNSTGEALGEAQTRPILEAYGLNLIPGGMAEDVDAAIEIAEQVGYPVALKIVSPQVLHKSDAGGIALKLTSADDVKAAVQKMKVDVLSAVPQAEIEGYLVEKMAPKGLEVIVGMRRDPTFGPLMMFGLGGVYVELFKDVGFGVAPLTPQRAKDMINSTKAGHLLQGYRGDPPYDMDAVIDTIGKLSQIALDFPLISEMEINPLLVLPENQGAIVLDARMILSQQRNEE